MYPPASSPVASADQEPGRPRRVQAAGQVRRARTAAQARTEGRAVRPKDLAAHRKGTRRGRVHPNPVTCGSVEAEAVHLRGSVDRAGRRRGAEGERRAIARSVEALDGDRVAAGVLAERVVADDDPVLTGDIERAGHLGCGRVAAHERSVRLRDLVRGRERAGGADQADPNLVAGCAGEGVAIHLAGGTDRRGRRCGTERERGAGRPRRIVQGAGRQPHSRRWRCGRRDRRGSCGCRRRRAGRAGTVTLQMTSPFGSKTSASVRGEARSDREGDLDLRAGRSAERVAVDLGGGGDRSGKGGGAEAERRAADGLVQALDRDGVAPCSRFDDRIVELEHRVRAGGVDRARPLKGSSNGSKLQPTSSPSGRKTATSKSDCVPEVSTSGGLEPGLLRRRRTCSSPSPRRRSSLSVGAAAEADRRATDRVVQTLGREAVARGGCSTTRR